MVAPLIALAAQLYSKQEAEREARRQEVQDLMKQRAQMLGGNTMGIDAAVFQRNLANQTYSTPQQIMDIYGSFGGKKTPSQKQALDADLAPNKTAYTLMQPEQTQLQPSSFLSGDDDDKWTRRMSLDWRGR